MSYKLRFNVDQLHRFGRALVELAPRPVQRMMEELTSEASSIALGIAQARVPVRTGALRQSITVQQSGFARWEFAANMHYAGFVEYGTRFMRARPYMRPAIREAQRYLQGELPRRIPGMIADFLNELRQASGSK